MAYAPFARPIAADDSFSLASITEGSVTCDWRELLGEDAEGWQVILPAFLRSDIEERAPDLWADYPKEKALYDVDGDAEVSDEDLRDAFRDSDGYDDWRNSFEPMMNYYWTIDLQYRTTAEIQAYADRMGAWGISCSLVEIGEHADDLIYGIAFTGGGMNLMDHLCAAYIACGQVPPIQALDNLTGSFPSYLVPRLPMDEITARATDWLQSRINGMERLRAACHRLKVEGEAGE